MGACYSLLLLAISSYCLAYSSLKYMFSIFLKYIYIYSCVLCCFKMHVSSWLDTVLVFVVLFVSFLYGMIVQSWVSGGVVCGLVSVSFSAAV